MIRNTLTYKYAVNMGILNFAYVLILILVDIYMGCPQGYGFVVLLYLLISAAINALLYIIGIAIFIKDFIQRKNIPAMPKEKVTIKSGIKIFFEIIFIGFFILQIVPIFLVLYSFIN